jgi:diguanylate cyclase (GGDEF)-like protein
MAPDPASAANRRDAAAITRDAAADARDAATEDIDLNSQAAGDRRFAARDRDSAMLDREAASERDSAETAGDVAAAARDLTAAKLETIVRAAGEGAAAELDTHADILLDVAAAMRTVAATIRDSANLGHEDGTPAAGRVLAAQGRAISATFRATAALHAQAATARDDAAQARDMISANADSFPQAAEDRVLAASDRAAAALDRHSAALDRLDASDTLQIAYRDSLTGALVRSAGREQLNQCVERAHRNSESLIVAYIDVDHLKTANDARGHAAGDELLRRVARCLRDGLRSYDIMVRYGGDEFVCALPGAQVEEARKRLSDIRSTLTGLPNRASFSFGLAELRANETLDELLARADRQMYEHRVKQRATAPEPVDHTRRSRQ